MNRPDHYTTLGVERTASADDIRKAYRTLVLLWHPDRSPTDPDAPENFARLREAYEVLSHPNKRAAYDQLHFGAVARMGSVARPNAASAPEVQEKEREASVQPSAPRRRRPVLRYAENDLSSTDLATGTALAILFVAVFQPAEVQRPELVEWGVARGLAAGGAAFLTLVILDRTSDLWHDFFDPYAWSQELEWGFRALATALVGTFIALWGTTGNYLPVIFTTGLSAGLAASIGGGFGRAFVSTNTSLRGQAVGMAIGAVVAVLLATFFAASSALISALPLSGFVFYDALGRSVAAASAAAGAIAAFASLREIEVIEN